MLPANDDGMGSAKRWTKTGMDCHESKADCENCSIWKIFHRKHDAGCYQVESNQQLMDRGIQPEITNLERTLDKDLQKQKLLVSKAKHDSTHEKKDRKLYGLSSIGKSGRNSDRSEASRKLRRRIAEILIDEPDQTASLNDIAKALDRECFLGVLWDSRAIHDHVRVLYTRHVLTINKQDSKVTATMKIEMGEFAEKMAPIPRLQLNLSRAEEQF